MKKFFKTFLKMKYNSFVVYLSKRVSPPISPQGHSTQCPRRATASANHQREQRHRSQKQKKEDKTPKKERNKKREKKQSKI